MTMSLCVCRIADLFPFDVFFPPDLIKIKMKKTGHLLSVLFMPAIDSGHGGHRIVDVAFVQLFHVFYLFIFIVFPFFFLWFLLCFFCFYVLFFNVFQPNIFDVTGVSPSFAYLFFFWFLHYCVQTLPSVFLSILELQRFIYIYTYIQICTRTHLYIDLLRAYPFAF